MSLSSYVSLWKAVKCWGTCNWHHMNLLVFIQPWIMWFIGKFKQLPVKVALSTVTAITQSCIRSLKLHSKVEICFPLQVSQKTNCTCADPARWQQDPDPVTQLQVHRWVRNKHPMRPMRRPSWLLTRKKNTFSQTNKYCFWATQLHWAIWGPQNLWRFLSKCFTVQYSTCVFVGL